MDWSNIEMVVFAATAQNALAVGRLVPELTHDDDVLLASHAGAITPPRRQLQQRKIARFNRHACVNPRHAQIGYGKRD